MSWALFISSVIFERCLENEQQFWRILTLTLYPLDCDVNDGRARNLFAFLRIEVASPLSLTRFYLLTLSPVWLRFAFSKRIEERREKQKRTKQRNNFLFAARRNKATVMLFRNQLNEKYVCSCYSDEMLYECGKHLQWVSRIHAT